MYRLVYALMKKGTSTAALVILIPYISFYNTVFQNTAESDKFVLLALSLDMSFQSCSQHFLYHPRYH